MLSSNQLEDTVNLSMCGSETLKHWNTIYCSPSWGSDETSSCAVSANWHRHVETLRFFVFKLDLSLGSMLWQWFDYALARLRHKTQVARKTKTKKKPIMFWLKQISTPVVSKPSRKLYGCLLMIVETLECCSLHLAAVSPICCAMRWTYYDLCCADVTEMKLIGCWLKWSADNVKCRHFILATGLKIWWWWKYETLASSGSKPHFSWGTCPVIGQAVAGYTWISNLVASYQLHRG